MATMIERIKAMEAHGDWAKIRRIGQTWLTVASNSDSTCARLHASLSTAYFVTATSTDDWNEALRHALLCRDLASFGSDLYVYALQKLSSLYVDLGDIASARRYALQYVALVGNREGFAYYTAFVFRDLGLIAYRRGDFRTSVRLNRKALSLFASIQDDENACRTATIIAWALIRSGEYDEARRVLPSTVPDSIEYLRLGVEAVLYAAEGKSVKARRLGRLALSDSNRLLHDSIDAAEVAYVLALTVRRCGDRDGSASLVAVARTFCALQDVTLDSATLPIVLNRGLRGGEILLEATEGRGSCNPLDGACFTCGVA